MRSLERTAHRWIEAWLACLFGATRAGTIKQMVREVMKRLQESDPMRDSTANENDDNISAAPEHPYAHV